MAADYLLDDQAMLFGARRANGFGTANFYVREIPRDHANAMIRRHHYSHTIVANSYVHLGVFIDGAMLGVLQFGYAMNPSSGGAVVEGTANDQYPELNRMWLNHRAPRLSESQAIAYGVRYIRRASPSVKWLQSFADERCGLNGAVYQACNFVFVGEHLSTFWEVDSNYFHNVIMTAKGRGELGTWLRADADRAIWYELRQFRYLFFMARVSAAACSSPSSRFPRRSVLETSPWPTGASRVKLRGGDPDFGWVRGCVNGVR